LTDGWNFAVTIFSTMVFGDISVTSQSAHLVVTFQMLLDPVILGVGIIDHPGIGWSVVPAPKGSIVFVSGDTYIDSLDYQTVAYEA
jgi:hypothetical protein